MDTFENNEWNSDESEESLEGEAAAAEDLSEAFPTEANGNKQPEAAAAEEMIPAESAQSQDYVQYSAADNAASAFNAGRTGAKESPYANSPYYTNNWQNAQNNAYRQPGYQANGYSAGYANSDAPMASRPVKAPRKKNGVLRAAFSALLTLSVVAGGCFVTGAAVNRRWEKENEKTVNALNEKIDALQKEIERNKRTESAAVPGNAVSAEGMSPSQVYARNVDSVVAISSTVQSTSVFGQTSQGTSTGSGFIITEDGYVVTNYHVVEGGTNIQVITNSGDEYSAKLVGSDSVNDVAVLKVEASGLPAAILGSSDALNIGDMVVAIGNPLGQLTATQTVGYVSGKNREVTTDNSIISMIQTDAAINAGNSGGPLFNMRGEVVGITTAKYSGTTNSGASIEGIGFAIPIDDVMSIIGDLQNYGYVTGAYLGVTVRNTDSASAAMYGLPMGAYVDSVVSGGSADRAGIQPKDIIIKLGDYEVSSITELTRALRRFKANDVTTIVVIRSGREISLNITLDEKPQDLNGNNVQPNAQMPSEGDYDQWYDYFFGNKDDKG